MWYPGIALVVFVLLVYGIRKYGNVTDHDEAIVTILLALLASVMWPITIVVIITGVPAMAYILKDE